MAFLCGCATEPPSSPPFRAPEPAPAWTPVASAAQLEILARDRLATRGEQPAVVFRVTNHGEQAILVDLRDLGRVVRPEAEAAPRLPLSDAQVAELSEISALTQIRAGSSITYAVAYALGPCEGTTTVPLGGVLVALDGDRTLELVADGARTPLACLPPGELPAGTTWVSGDSPLSASGRSPADFAEGLPELLRGTSVTGAADVALLPFSFDARPVERWRYDACVATGACPARVVAQPPGSIHAPAVGMTGAGVAALCAARGLRPLTPEEIASVADPARPLIDDPRPEVVTAGLRCARTEALPPP